MTIKDYERNERAKFLNSVPAPDYYAMAEPGILSGIIQAVIIVIPVWITVSMYFLKRIPVSYDKFGIFLASILSIGFWQIIRMMNIITGYISPTVDGGPGDASVRLILRLDEFLIISWFLILSLAYLSVSDEVERFISSLRNPSDQSENDRHVKGILVTVGYFAWFGIVLLTAIVLGWIGGIIIR